MQREMSSHLDASFSTRGSGQLVNEEVVATRAKRIGPMEEMPPQGLPRDGQYNLQPTTQAIMLPGMGALELTVPFFGTLNWKQLALGAGLGVVAYMMFTKKTRKMRQAKARVGEAAMSG